LSLNRDVNVFLFLSLFPRFPFFFVLHFALFFFGKMYKNLLYKIKLKIASSFFCLGRCVNKELKKLNKNNKKIVFSLHCFLSVLRCVCDCIKNQMILKTKTFASPPSPAYSFSIFFFCLINLARVTNAAGFAFSSC